MMRMKTSLFVGLLGCALLALGMSSRGASTSKGKLLLFLSTDCPVSARYTSRINDLYSLRKEQLSFEALFPNDLETNPSVAAYMADRGYRFPHAIDLGAVQAKRLKVSLVPTAVLLDGQDRIVYEGPIDDNPDTSLVHQRYLDKAIAALIAGKAPATRAAKGPGCLLMPSAVPPAANSVTYAQHVKPIVDAHCISCHRPGEVAPFSLIGYRNAKKWAPMIAFATSKRQMPPWKAIHGYGEFARENVLSETELEILKRWNDAGAPRGKLTRDDDDASPAPEWALGTPDLIVAPSKPYHLAADGGDVYRNFVVKNDSSETRYVSAMDVKPGDRKVVHHVVVFVDGTGAAERLNHENTDGQEGYTSSGGGPGFMPETSFGGWVPGSRPARSPEGTAFLLKPKTAVVVQVHYHKNGKEATDLTRVGLYFDKQPPKHVMQIAWMLNTIIDIPAGDSHHKEHLTYHVPADITLYGVMPHMHLLGKSMKAEVTYPDGRKEPLIYVDSWDFQWQLSYAYKAPLKLPKGSLINIDAVFDNSENNPNNPSKPPKEVGWGEQTTDEMFLLVGAYSRD
jgi:mono/diheme cytochrome c family protein